MQIPVMNGVYANDLSDFRTSYPINLIPVPKEEGISNGYLRPADGIDQFSVIDGLDRGGINWDGDCYRVCGTNLVKVLNDGSIQVIGDVGGSGQCSFDYSFDYLAIRSSSRLYLYNKTDLKQVTDGDLGQIKDVVWIDGYFMVTDGEFLIVTELLDPFQVNALKYGSSEIDPDPVLALQKLNNEVYSIGRYTIEVYDNIGGELFPLQRIEGAVIQKGTVGTYTCCKFMDALAFIGSGRNEPVAIWIGATGQAQRISNREIEQTLHEFTEAELSSCLVETLMQDGHQWLYIHLPNQTLVYDAAASQATSQPVWFKLSSGLELSQYNAKNHVWCYDKWIVGHASLNKLGTTTNKHSNHYDQVVGWEFGTTIVYNESRGAIFHQIELICLTGNVDFKKNPTISTQYSVNGVLWSQPKFIYSGELGDRAKRLVWFQQGHMRNWRIQKFNGTSDSRLSIARLEVQLEPLAV